MHLGLDFDNTIVSYDRLFHRCAVERGLIPANAPVAKSAVRAHLWSQPEGNTPWTELQGVVYGQRMAEAEPFPGVEDFLRFCHARGVRISIVSHKDEFPALGPRVNLREASRAWMKAHGFFDVGGLGLQHDDVMFEDSRDAKVARIGALDCSHFVDDLIEVLRDPKFPSNTHPILFDPAGFATRDAGMRLKIFRSWPEIRAYVEERLVS